MILFGTGSSFWLEFFSLCGKINVGLALCFLLPFWKKVRWCILSSWSVLFNNPHTLLHLIEFDDAINSRIGAFITLHNIEQQSPNVSQVIRTWSPLKRRLARTVDTSSEARSNWASSEPQTKRLGFEEKRKQLGLKIMKQLTHIFHP